MVALVEEVAEVREEGASSTAVVAEEADDGGWDVLSGARPSAVAAVDEVPASVASPAISRTETLPASEAPRSPKVEARTRNQQW